MSEESQADLNNQLQQFTIELNELVASLGVNIAGHLTSTQLAERLAAGDHLHPNIRGQEGPPGYTSPEDDEDDEDADNVPISAAPRYRFNGRILTPSFRLDPGIDITEQQPFIFTDYVIPYTIIRPNRFNNIHPIGRYR